MSVLKLWASGGILISALCLCACEHSSAIRPQTSAASTAGERTSAAEYAVCSVIIEKMYINDEVRMVVIKELSNLHPLTRNVSLELERLQSDHPTIALETVADFQAKNKERSPFDKRFEIRVPFILINEGEYQEIFQDPQGWDVFYERYPDSQGLMTLSRVGFNTSMNQALVYVGNQRAGFGGEGYYVLLSKEDQTWTIIKTFGVWIS